MASRGRRSPNGDSRSLAVNDEVDGQLQDDQTAQIVAGFVVQMHQTRSLRSEANGEEDEIIPLPREVIERGIRGEYVQYGQTLADFAEEFDTIFGQPVRNMVAEDYNIDENTTAGEMGEMYMGTMQGLFANGINTSRIVMMLMFSSELSHKLQQRYLGTTIPMVIQVVVRFINSVPLVTNQATGEQQTIAQWVEGQGGWIAALAATRRQVQHQISRGGLSSWDIAACVGVNLLMIGWMVYRRR